jgi:conjugal transfer pilus assembly protein TraL
VLADTYIPRRLDDQWKIGFWDVDVAAPTLFGMFLGYVSGTKLSFAICVAAGVGLSRTVAHIKADKHPAFALHWVYWHLPQTPLTRLRRTPPSYVHRMVG